MADDNKILIVEKNGVELEYHEELELKALNIPYDNTDSGLIATDVKVGLDEVANTVATSASPGFSFGRASNVNSGTFLNVEGVPSNKAGRWVYIANASVTKVFVSNEQNTTFTIEILSHDGNGTNLTSLGTVTVTSAYGDDFDVNWPVATNKQLAIRLNVGSARNIVAGLELQGTNI